MANGIIYQLAMTGVDFIFLGYHSLWGDPQIWCVCVCVCMRGRNFPQAYFLHYFNPNVMPHILTHNVILTLTLCLLLFPSVRDGSP